jgi:aspartate aminotransferase-like enzyme
VSDRAVEAIDGDRGPFYHDLDRHLAKAPQGQTPFTSALPLFRAMAAAVAAIRDEGMADRIERHRRFAAAFRAGFTAMGLALFPAIESPSAYSNTVTAVALPEAVRGDADAFFDAVADRNVSISGGQAHLGGEIFRVSNMGALSPDDVVRGVRTVGEALADVGVSVPVEEGVAAAQAELDGGSETP